MSRRPAPRKSAFVSALRRSAAEVVRDAEARIEEARAEQIASIKAGRLGRPEEFGDAFAYLCSAQAGFMSGQSLQLDGGSYEGIF